MTGMTATPRRLATAVAALPRFAVARAAGISPLPPALGATLGASLAFMLPVATPPNAIVYGSGRIRILQMVRAGVLYDLLGVGVVLLLLRILCPLLGLV